MTLEFGDGTTRLMEGDDRDSRKAEMRMSFEFWEWPMRGTAWE